MIVSQSRWPAVLGASPAFPAGLPLVRPQIPDVPAVTRRLAEVLESGQLTNGRRVAELEERVADLLGVAHIVAVSSCTAGLMLVYQALGVRGSVFMPSFTFAASAHAVVWAGGTPVFGDVRRDDATLDVDATSDRLATASAVSATHIYGTPAHVQDIDTVAEQAGLPVVYDAAHALGSHVQGRPVGGFGTAEVFSLSPTKVTTACEGGLVVTHDPGLAKAVRLGRNYGNSGDYDCTFPGLNARMSELHAVVALAGLEVLAERIAGRAELVAAFRARLGNVVGVAFPVVADGDISTYKDLTMFLDPEVVGLTTGEVQAALTAEGVDSRRYFFPPIHRQRAYAHLRPSSPLPVTDVLAQQTLTVPLWSSMTTADVLRLADVVHGIVREAPRVREVLEQRR